VNRNEQVKAETNHIAVRGRYLDDHQRLGVVAERVLKNLRQNRVAKWNMLIVHHCDQKEFENIENIKAQES
jgi:hypothetical protein